MCGDGGARAGRICNIQRDDSVVGIERIRMMLKSRVVLAVTGLLMLTGLTGCQAQKDQGPDYADDEAMDIIAGSIMARADLVDSYEGEGVDTTSMKSLQSYIDIEREHVDKLRTRVFEDSEMQESVLAYINTLDDADKALESNPVASAEFHKEWNSIYDKRSVLLKEFVEEYGLEVDEKHQETLDEMIANGAAATKRSQVEEALEGLMSSVAFEKQNDGYGFTTYCAVIENTTGVDFENVGMTLSLYDADGVRAEEAYIGAASWKSGERVRFEAVSEVDAAETRVSIDYYDVVD